MLNELIEKLDGIIAQKSTQQAKDGVVTDEDNSSDNWCEWLDICTPVP
jgi:hypothetical protein